GIAAYYAASRIFMQSAAGYGAKSNVTVTWTVHPLLGGQQPIIGSCDDEMERMGPTFLPLAAASASALVRALARAACVAFARSAADGCTVPKGAPPLPEFAFT